MFGGGASTAIAPSAITGYPVGLNAAKTCFLDQNGNPCFALGEDAFDLAVQLTKAQIEQYLSDRAARGVNLIWIGAVDNIYQASPPANANGDSPFTSGNFANFNSSYWNFIDYVMQRCLVWGITVLFNPEFVGHNDSQGWHDVFYNLSDAVVQAYAAFLGTRYGGFPNLIWLAGGDADPNNATSYAKINTFMVALKAADAGSHLMTLEASRTLDAGGNSPNSGYTSVDAHTIAYGSVQSWLDINWVYELAGSGAAPSQRAYAQGKPCLLGEDGYEIEYSTDPITLRTQAWSAVLGGSTLGRLNGNGAIWAFSSPNAGNGVGAGPPTWQTELSSVGSVSHQLLGKLFRSRRHQLLVPDTAGSVMTVGASNGSICARDSEGKTIIAYLPSSQTVTMDMTKITDAGGFASCNWFNPNTGAVTAIGNIANTGTHNFTSPDSNDWVLVIDSAAAAFRTPGT